MAVRDCLIGSAIELVRRHGVAGTGLSELLAHSGVSRRSIYLSFPGGKSELIAESTRVAGRAMSGWLRELAAAAPQRGIATFVDHWKQVLRTSDYQAGCPVVAATLGRSAAPEAAAAAAEIYQEWQQILADRLAEREVDTELAQSLATTMLAAVEGAVILSMAENSTAPLDRVGRHLGELLDLHVPAESAG
ncbi:TetR/AcrR family transcriptional regulator [Nocardia cyriacigeorgica]|uniref:TetR/AcrR family transcriptional regulator n=1 Tax=Nocardia cyriacigeorgica TaxID=135487 RepID=UPI0018961C1E|nr:TetR/AcrR family transcriptional regulator [Nocardia cyriacigeorgica]MBF6456445.1 TetR/AcrR family transcriptional regulator [Nocardia cyriacigeorgica]MBF6551251.1 TetR/AcrR family transcriptional regulator [Nocardia cyriacigeorgica]